MPRVKRGVTAHRRQKKVLTSYHGIAQKQLLILRLLLELLEW